MDGLRFREIAGCFATGVLVITTRDAEGKAVGMTINSFTSLSLDPLLVMYNIAKSASLYRVFMASDRFAVNILAANQEHLARRFAQKGIERFAGVPHTSGRTGSPILAGTLGHLDCTVAMRHPGGDHTIIIGEVQDGETRDGDALVFYRGRYAHAPSSPVVELLSRAS